MLCLAGLFACCLLVAAAQLLRVCRHRGGSSKLRLKAAKKARRASRSLLQNHALIAIACACRVAVLVASHGLGGRLLPLQLLLGQLPLCVSHTVFLQIGRYGCKLGSIARTNARTHSNTHTQTKQTYTLSTH